MLAAFKRAGRAAAEAGRSRPKVAAALSGTGLFTFLGKSSSSRFDVVDDDLQDRIGKGYEDRSALDWKQRLGLMWRVDECDDLSPELNFVATTTLGTTVAGICLGAWIDSKETYARFIKENRHTMFKSPFDSQRAMQDQITLSLYRGGFRVGWRMGLLTLMFLSVSTSLTAIRNKVHPVDHAAAGFVMGSCWRVLGGPRAMLVAGAAGGVLGLFAGCCYSAIEWVSGETTEERWLREYRYIQDKHSSQVKESSVKQEESIGKVMIQYGEPITPQEEQKAYKFLSAVLKLRSAIGLD